MGNVLCANLDRCGCSFGAVLYVFQNDVERTSETWCSVCGRMLPFTHLEDSRVVKVMKPTENVTHMSVWRNPADGLIRLTSWSGSKRAGELLFRYHWRTGLHRITVSCMPTMMSRGAFSTMVKYGTTPDSVTLPEMLLTMHPKTLH